MEEGGREQGGGIQWHWLVVLVNLMDTKVNGGYFGMCLGEHHGHILKISHIEQARGRWWSPALDIVIVGKEIEIGAQ